ncbi:MAG: sensor histidine kinase KdpD [Candidatus Binatus sp.]
MASLPVARRIRIDARSDRRSHVARMRNERNPGSEGSPGASADAKRGRLKVYLGAAVGVGKTYRMLQEAHQLRAEGHDVVLGYIETHGRRETAAMIEGLETTPLREISYRGAIVREMDVEAILARKPEFAVVDELAHTNTPGSRHRTRCEDVEELLGAGISVITAVNLQHIQSMTPIVKRLTGITVTETIPDSFLAQADEIVDVDISAEELLQRLQEGKIFPIEQVSLALRNFFKPDNLTVLRELTLREVARDIGRQREDEGALKRQQTRHLIATERMLVCLPSDQREAERLLCKGWREAGNLYARWYAVHVEVPEEAVRKISPADFRALLDNVNLAGDLGAEFVWLKAEDPVAAIADFAHENHVPKVILGRPQGSLISRLFRRSVPERLLYQARDFDVAVAADES